jgi:hypothetical protein
VPSLITPENLPHVLAAFGGLITAIGGLTVWRAWKEPPKPGSPDAAMVALADNTQALRSMVDAMKSQNTHFADNNEMFKALGPVLSDMRHDGADSKAHLAAIRDALNRRK